MRGNQTLPWPPSPPAAVTQGGQSPQMSFLSPLPALGQLGLCQLGLCGRPPHSVPRPTQGQFPAQAAWQSRVLGTPHPWVGWGAHPRTQSPTNTSIGFFSHLPPVFFPPKLRQIFPGHESWTSNPVPNPHHTIQLGQKSKTSHLSESRCKCFSPQAHNAEAVSEIADLYPFFSPQTL